MTVYYFSGSPIVAPVTFNSNVVLLSSDTASLKQQRRTTDAQRWELSFGLVSNGGEADIFLGAVAGLATASTMTMPQLLSVDKRITATGQLTVAANALKGASSVQVTGSPVAKLVPKGSFITFSNHTKVYVTTADYTTSATAGPLPIFPNLRVDLTATTTLVNHPGSTVKPQLRYFRSVDTLKGITYSDGVLVDVGTVSVIEALV